MIRIRGLTAFGLVPDFLAYQSNQFGGLLTRGDKSAALKLGKNGLSR